MATNVPAPVLTDNGFAAPDEIDVFAGVVADLQAAFGGNLNPDMATPQGQIATSLTAVRAAVDAVFLLITNQVDPASASGRMQDAIGRIYFMTRNPPNSTVVAAICTGAPGTVILAGALAIATDGTIYQATGTATIASSGTATVNFAAIDTGPVACPVGALNRIYRAIPGWDAIINPAAGIAGGDVESRADFEARRVASVAINALGILPSIRAAVLSVSGVLDAYVTENSGANALTTGGVTLPAHSLYVAAQGGTDADVARAIWSKKNPGCDYYGNITITVEDLSSGYVPPYPAYNITFQRPAALPVYFGVTIASSSAVPSDAAAQIKAAIVKAFTGADGGQRVRIGTTIYALRYVAGIVALGPWAQLVSLHVGTSASPTGDSVAVNINQYPVLDPGNIAVVLQ